MLDELPHRAGGIHRFGDVFGTQTPAKVGEGVAEGIMLQRSVVDRDLPGTGLADGDVAEGVAAEAIGEGGDTVEEVKGGDIMPSISFLWMQMGCTVNYFAFGFVEVPFTPLISQVMLCTEGVCFVIDSGFAFPTWIARTVNGSFVFCAVDVMAT